MLKNKKLITAIISFTLGGFLLVGCGDKSTNTSLQSTPTSTEDTKVIKVGSSGSYYPFGFIENEKLQGIEIDIWDEIGRRSGYKIDYVISVFSGLFGLLDTGKIDTIANQIDISDERKEKYDFSEPYMYNPLKFTVKKDSNITSLNDLKGKKVAVSVGGNEGKELTKVDPNGEIKQVIYGDSTNVFLEVQNDKVDACLISGASSLSAIKKGNLDLKIIGEPLYLETNAYPFAKNQKNKELLSMVNKIIAEMHQDGTIAKISNKWLGADITKKQVKE